jgi:hypothetical protein
MLKFIAYMRRQAFKIEWGAPEYEHKERSADWFWAMGIVVLSIAVTCIIFGNIILAILILLSAFSLSLFLNREPEIIDVIINEKGITRENIFYPYQTLHSFWIDDEHSHPKILLRSDKLLMPLIIIPLGDNVDIDKLHTILSEFLKEEPHELPWAEKFLEYLGF